MSLDPVSDILKLAHAESVLSGGFAAGGCWAIRFPPPDRIKFFALVKGSCWLRLDGAAEALRINTGDVLLLAAPRGFVLAGDLDTPPIDAMQVFTTGSGRIEHVGDAEAEDCIQLGGHVRLDPASAGLLADVLPALIHVSAAAPQAGVLQWLLQQLVQERRADLPGAGLASTQLAQLMFVQILRAHLATPDALPASWLRAVGDARLAPALRLMHGAPEHAWQLAQLARAAAMSRTTFALRFRRAAGVAPLTYLAHWRMRLAQRALREQDTSLATLAGQLGYTSESAFSHAFKRITGEAPQHYRSSARVAAAQAQGNAAAQRTSHRRARGG